MKKYSIWNKRDTVYTPSGAEFTAEQWMDRYKWTKIPNAVVVMGGGTFNGSFIAELEQFRDAYMKQGAPITTEMTAQQVIEAAEAWDNRVIESEPTAEERIAAAMEYQNLLSMEG